MQPAATCGECCHHYSNVMQISHFQLIPHFPGNGTLNQGRDTIREGSKLETSKEDESTQNRANDTEWALSSRQRQFPSFSSHEMLISHAMLKGTIIGLGHAGLKINFINM